MCYLIIVYDIERAGKQAVECMERSSAYDKIRFDSTKARVRPFSTGDFVLLKTEERNQTKLDPKYKGPFKVIEVLAGDRYVLRALDSNRTYKYAHDRLRNIPDSNDHLDDRDLDNDDSNDDQSNLDNVEGVGPSTSSS